jgi:single-stranded DNA-binding protein
MNNSITIVGYVGQNPKTVRFGDTNNKVVKFSVGVKEFSPNTDEPKTMWVDVDAWNGLGDRVLKTLAKGREVVVNGRLAISNYSTEIDGVTLQVAKPVIKMTSFHACGKKIVEQKQEPAETAEQN